MFRREPREENGKEHERPEEKTEGYCLVSSFENEINQRKYFANKIQRSYFILVHLYEHARSNKRVSELDYSNLCYQFNQLHKKVPFIY